MIHMSIRRRFLISSAINQPQNPNPGGGSGDDSDIIITGNNVIYYTTTDGNIVSQFNEDAFSANVVYNTYSRGRGIMVFDTDLYDIYEGAFCATTEYSNLEAIVLPPSIFRIDNNTFKGCPYLNIFTLKSTPPNIGDPFTGVVNLFDPTILQNKNFTIYVPEDALNSYLYNQNWRVYKDYIKGI